MSLQELEEGYQEYLESIGHFYKKDKMELALLLARLCVLEPHLPGQIEREMPAIRLVKEFAKDEIIKR